MRLRHLNDGFFAPEIVRAGQEIGEDYGISKYLTVLYANTSARDIVDPRTSWLFHRSSKKLSNVGFYPATANARLCRISEFQCALRELLNYKVDKDSVMLVSFLEVLTRAPRVIKHKNIIIGIDEIEKKKQPLKKVHGQLRFLLKNKQTSWRSILNFLTVL